SVRARVTNINNELPDKMTVLEFKDAILNQMKQEYPEMDEYVLTEDDLARIQEIRDSQFATWDWTYGQTPEYTVERSVRYPAGKITTYIKAEK
ncbi:lipoate--protein ligase family protein, partial [Streptococcus suis]